jgi:hypothetical protein
MARAFTILRPDDTPREIKQGDLAESLARHPSKEAAPAAQDTNKERTNWSRAGETTK